MLIKLRTGVRISIWPKQSYRLLSSLNAMLHKTDKANGGGGGGGGGGWGSGNCKVPKRKEQIRSLKNEQFDILIVGGGAIGCGCALEAATRGLKTALIEAEDFGSGASCKSSKLIEGSNSYLHAAIQGADLQQIFMLQQVLNERATMLTIAPHLNRVQPMLMPIYSPLRLPLYWLGLKMYDAMAGMSNVRGSHFLSKQATLNEFPLLRKNGLLGSLIYYDVQLDDARMCLALAMTAVRHGATVANYVRLLELLPNCQQDCRSVLVEDALKEDSFVINTRVIINATGAGTDVLRKLDDCRVSPIAVPHLGTHIALPGYYGSQNCGLLFPSSDAYDDALIMLPFENRLLVGSMDVQRPEMTDDPPAPTADVVDCLLSQTCSVLDDCVQLREEDVLSAWTGIKPSILCPTTTTSDSIDDCNQQKAQPSNEIVPNFLLEVSGNQLITLAGGRWSTYRVMAVDAINTAIESCLLEPQSDESISSHLLLDGADNYCCMLPLDLVQAYDLPMDVAQHLAESYGSNAPQLLSTSKCSLPGSGHQRLHSQYPYIQAEVIYACQREYACHLVDVIARRLRVAFVDVRAAHEMLSTVLKLMSEELDWDERRQAKEYRMAQKYLQKEMGLGCIIKPKRQQLKINDDQCEQQQDLYSAIGDATFFCSALNSTYPATSHINTDCEPNYTLGPRPVQSMMSATKIASGSALVNETNPIHRSSIIRGTSSVGHLMRGNSSKDAKKWNTTVKRGKSDRTTDRSDRSDRSNRSDARSDKPPKPAAEPERLETCSFSPYVIANSGPQGDAPKKLDVKAKAKNISEMRTDPNRRFNRDMQKPKHQNQNKTPEESELLTDNAGSNDDRDLHGSSGKALEGISRVKSRKSSSAMQASEMDDLETEGSKESVNKMKLRPKIFDSSAGRPKKFNSIEDKQIKYRIESLKSKSRDKTPANENAASPASETREANKTRRTKRNVSDINADSTTSSAAKKDQNNQSKQSSSTTHPKGSEKPAISKSSHSSSNPNDQNNNKRYVSTISTGENDSAIVPPTNISPELTIILPNRTVSRLNALNNNNDKFSERSIVGTAVELDSRLHDTVQILRNATTSLKKITKTMRKAKAMNQLQSKDAANARSSSNHHVIPDVRQPSTPCELIKVKQPKKVADETDKLLDK